MPGTQLKTDIDAALRRSDATLREISFTHDTIIYIGSGVRSAGRSDDKLRHFHERMVFSKSPQSSRVPQV